MVTAAVCGQKTGQTNVPDRTATWWSIQYHYVHSLLFIINSEVVFKMIQVSRYCFDHVSPNWKYFSELLVTNTEAKYKTQHSEDQ